MTPETIARALTAEQREALLSGVSRIPGVTVSLCVMGLTDHSIGDLCSILHPRPLGLAVRAALTNEGSTNGK